MGWTPHAGSRGNPLFRIIAGRRFFSAGGIVERFVTKHGDGDAENAVHDASEGARVIVSLGAKGIVVGFEVLVAAHGDTGPMMES